MRWAGTARTSLVDACWAASSGLLLLAFDDPVCGLATVHMSAAPLLDAQLLPLSLPGLQGRPHMLLCCTHVLSAPLVARRIDMMSDWGSAASDLAGMCHIMQGGWGPC